MLLKCSAADDNDGGGDRIDHPHNDNGGDGDCLVDHPDNDMTVMVIAGLIIQIGEEIN